MKRMKPLIPLLALCLALTACGPKEALPEASSSAPGTPSSIPDVSQSKPDLPTPDISTPDASSSQETPFTEAELDQARQAALDYYAGTVFDVTELVFEEQLANTVSFTVRCSKGGVAVDPDRTISLEHQNGVWTVISEGY